MVCFVAAREVCSSKEAQRWLVETFRVLRCGCSHRGARISCWLGRGDYPWALRANSGIGVGAMEVNKQIVLVAWGALAQDVMAAGGTTRDGGSGRDCETLSAAACYWGGL